MSFLYQPLGYRLFPYIAVLGIPWGSIANAVAPHVRRERTAMEGAGQRSTVNRTCVH
jgi:hypothetical protein